MARTSDHPPGPDNSKLLEPAPQMRIHVEARRRRVRRIALVILLAVAFVGLATAGTLWLDYSSATRILESRRLNDEALRSALTTPTTGIARGTVLVVMRPAPGSGSAPSAALLRVAEDEQKAWMLVVPADASLGAPGTGVGTIREVLAVKGRAGLVREIAARAGIPVTGYLEVEPASLAVSLEATGAAGEVPAEARLLSALRTAGAVHGVWDTLRMRGAVADALAPRAATTLSLEDLLELARGVDVARDATQMGLVPSIAVGDTRVVDADAFRALSAQLRSGAPFEVSKRAEENVVPSAISVTVWNGAGISGVAADAAERLRRAGYDVRVVTNANQFVYDDTLIVYTAGGEAAARRASLDLRGGRVVPRRGMYLFDTDLLVVVGKDWPAVR